jgi:hypothetical protein
MVGEGGWGGSSSSSSSSSKTAEGVGAQYAAIQLLGTAGCKSEPSAAVGKHVLLQSAVWKIC